MAGQITTRTYIGLVIAEIDYTPESGPLAGVSLRHGKPVRHPKAGPGVSFDYHAQSEVTRGRLQKGQNVFVRADDKPDLAALVAGLDAARAAAEADLAARAAALEPAGFLYRIGCDTASTYSVLWPGDADRDAVDRRCKEDPADPIRRWLRNDDLDRIAAETGAEALAPDYSSYRGWRFNRAGLDRLLALARERQDEADGRRAARDRVVEQRRQDALAEAAATGRRVVIKRWSEPCNDPREECDLDNVAEYALPDGSTKVERHHTW